MKVSIFDNVSGKFLAYGNKTDERIQALITAGHRIVEERHDQSKKWENGAIVEDAQYTSRKQAKETKRTNKGKAIKRLAAITGEFTQGGGLDAAKVNSALKDLISLYK